MLDIFIRACSYIAIIVLGIVLRRIGFFKKEDFTLLSKIVIRITLPAALISSAAGREIDPGMLTISLLGLGGGVAYMALAYLVNLHRDAERRAFDVLNTAGYNIGTFALPFTQSFLGSTGVLTASIFDVGNAFVCLGGAYGVASAIRDGKGFDVRRIASALGRSVPFLVHILTLLMNLAHIPIPGMVVSCAGIVANGNAFLAMLMIGVGFELSADWSRIGRILRIIAMRYSLAAVFALCCYFLLPFDVRIRQTLVILTLSPIGSAVPGFTAELKGDVGLSSAVNSVSIVISIVTIVTLLMVML